ncbi:MAG: hypothetical protein HYS23_01430 [Geobacter sp.]|nr:hypothetical protein [Geobacter sp.]
MKFFKFKKFSTVSAIAALFTFIATQAMAITAPAAGSFGYEAYNFLVNTILKGPFGAISAILLFLVTIMLLVKQQMVAGLICLTAAIVLINVSNMVTALGAIY